MNKEYSMGNEKEIVTKETTSTPSVPPEAV